MPIIPRIEQQLYPQYYIEMYSPTTWECVPNSRIEMDPHEHILAQKTVFLKSEASLSGKWFSCQFDLNYRFGTIWCTIWPVFQNELFYM